MKYDLTLGDCQQELTALLERRRAIQYELYSVLSTAKLNEAPYEAKTQELKRIRTRILWLETRIKNLKATT